MKCGDRGHVTALGLPCQQTISRKAAGCIWHISSPEHRSLIATKGSLASRMNRALPSTYQVQEFASEESIVTFAHELARMALTEDVDSRRVDSACRAASLALQAFSVKAQAQMVDALLRLEHGGSAFAMLERIRALPGESKPLPFRRVTVLPKPEGA